MGIRNRLLSADRKFWHVCYTCMQQTGHDTLKAVFYSEGPPVVVLGRAFTQCPRCGGTNTKPFQELKDEGSGAALLGAGTHRQEVSTRPVRSEQHQLA